MTANFIGNSAEEVKDLPQKWYNKITVEPIMFLAVLSFMLTAIVEQTFYIHKACTINHGYSNEICKNITKYEEINKMVHITVSNFHLWDRIASNVVPIILAPFLGAWSDRRGRKLPLLLGMCGKFLCTIMLFVNALQVTWPLEYIIFTSTLPGALTGNDVAVYSSCYSYIIDTSSESDRTKRLTILDIGFYAAMPISTILGSFLFGSIVNESYAIMFLIRTAILTTAIIYILLVLKWQTTSSQIGILQIGYQNWIPDFFNWKHLIESIKIVLKKRSACKRTYLWICIIVICLNGFIRDERSTFFLYTHRKFHWEVTEFSYYRTFQSVNYVIMLLIAIPIMNKLITIKDTIIAVITPLFTIVSRLFFALGNIWWLFYVGGALCGMGPIVGSISRSVMSKIVDVQERGKVFAILAIFDHIVPFVSTALYTQIYNITINENTGIFWLTIAGQIVIFILMLPLHISISRRSVQSTEKQNSTNKIDSLIK